MREPKRGRWDKRGPGTARADAIVEHCKREETKGRRVGGEATEKSQDTTRKCVTAKEGEVNAGNEKRWPNRNNENKGPAEETGPKKGGREEDRRVCVLGGDQDQRSTAGEETAKRKKDTCPTKRTHTHHTHTHARTTE